MSIEAMTYVKQLDVANPTSRMLLLIIAENTFNDSGVCRVGQAVLSHETRVPERTLRDHLRRLRREGVITIERSKDENGQMQHAAIGLVGFADFLASIRRRKTVSSGSAPQVDNDGSDTAIQRRNPPLASGDLSAAGQRRTVAGPYKESRTSKYRTSLPQTPEAETGSGEREQVEQAGEKIGTSSVPSGDSLPVAAAGWLTALRADDVHLAVVDGLVAPLLATLTVPRNVAPVAWLRLWRDAAGAIEMSPRLMAEVVRAIAIDRVRDLPWPKDLPAIVDAARARMLITLPAGDPRWAAWLAHDLLDPSKSAFARAVQRNRWAYQAETPWPPGTPPPEVEQLPLGTWRIAHGTPEHAAWLAVMRRTDPAAAQGADIAKRTLTQPTQWPEVTA